MKPKSVIVGVINTSVLLPHWQTTFSARRFVFIGCHKRVLPFETQQVAETLDPWTQRPYRLLALQAPRTTIMPGETLSHSHLMKRIFVSKHPK